MPFSTRDRPITASSVQIAHCRFVVRQFSRYGGAIYDHDSELLLADCYFQGDCGDPDEYCARDGGGIWSGSASLTLLRCAFTDLRVCGYGGAVYVVGLSSARLPVSVGHV